MTDLRPFFNLLLYTLEQFKHNVLRLLSFLLFDDAKIKLLAQIH